jgi:hypothetical protein
MVQPLLKAYQRQRAVWMKVSDSKSNTPLEKVIREADIKAE